jgi:precorrin-2/cobalt-factor-2 C20-methyltransferase
VPLAEGEEVVTIISGAKGQTHLKEVVEFSDNVVLMKTYRQLPQILAQIEEAGLKDCCCFVSRCGLEGEKVEKDFAKLLQMDHPHYLSLMILKKRGMEP